MGGARRHHAAARGAIRARITTLTTLGALGVAALAPARAHASPVELFGFGSRHAATAGAGAAAVDDFAAVYYNPAGLAAGAGRHATIGGLAAVSNLAIEDERIGLSDPVGAVVGVTAPAPLGGPLEGRIRLGIGLYLLPGKIAQITARFPDEPFFPYYQGRHERIVILPGVGVRITDRVQVGAAVNVLAGLDGAIVASEGSTRALEARVDEKVPTIARVIAGVAVQVTPALRLGATFRQRFEVAFATIADTEVAGEPIDLDLRASGQFTPHQLVVGAAYRQGGARGELDVTYARWSSYPGPFVAVNSALPLVGPLAGALPDVPFRDTVTVRLGGELATSDALTLRGGYAFETSPIPAEQPGVTNLMDGPKHTIATGVGLGWTRAGGKRARLDLHVAAQLVGARTLTKALFDPDADEPYDPFTSLRDEVTDDAGVPATQGAQISNPGYPGIEGGGQVFSAGVTLEVEL